MRFSVLTLLWLVAFAALALGAMVNADTVIARVFAPLVCVTCLLLSVSGAIYLEPKGGSFCTGFALFGIGYVLFAHFLDRFLNIDLISLLLIELWFGLDMLGAEDVVGVVRSFVTLGFALFGGVMTLLFYSRGQKQKVEAAEDPAR